MTTATFSLPVSGAVMLAVYDLGGREVARLVDGEANAGYHKAVWQAEGMPTGLYVMRLETPQGIASVRATLVK